MTNAEQKGYAVDTDALIQAWKTYYAPSFCAPFWSVLAEEHEAGRIISIDRVRSELRDSDMQEWIKSGVPPTFWAGVEQGPVVAAYGEMLDWVVSGDFYLDQAKDKFGKVADPWLVAYARVNGLTVVTLEDYNGDRRKDVPIPNLCERFGVECVDTFGMMKGLGLRFTGIERVPPKDG